MQVAGKFFALPHSREFEIHQADGQVLHGIISEEISIDLIKSLHGQPDCTAILSMPSAGTPLKLVFLGQGKPL